MTSNKKYGGLPWLQRWKRFAIDYALFLMIAVLVAVFACISPAFLSSGNVLMLLANASPLMILSTGMAFILLVGELDMSVGSTMCAGALLWGYGVTNWGLGIVPSTLLALAACAGIGLLNAFLNVRLKINSFLATLGMQIIITGVNRLCTNCIQLTLSDAMRTAAMRKVFGAISPMALGALVLLLVCQLVFLFTRYGRYVKATGTNRKAAKKTGIRVNRILTVNFVISSLFAGIAGIAHILVNSAALASSTGVGGEFDAITACVVGGVSLFGGVGSFVPGVLVGVLFIQLIENALGMIGVNAYLYPVFRGAIIFAAMAFDALKHSLGRDG